MHQDHVRVLLGKEPKKGKRQEGTVIRILERANQEVVEHFSGTRLWFYSL